MGQVKTVRVVDGDGFKTINQADFHAAVHTPYVAPTADAGAKAASAEPADAPKGKKKADAGAKA